MTKEQGLFAEILQKELNKVFEKHIESLKSAKVVGIEDYEICYGIGNARKDTTRQGCKYSNLKKVH